MGRLKTALLALSFGAFSLGAKASEVVCVNGDELFKLSKYAQELKKEADKRRNEILSQYREKAQKLIEKLKSLQKELSSGLLSDEAKKQKQKEFMELQRELQTLQIQTQQEMQNYIKTTLENLDKLTKSALKVLSKTEGFKIALDCNAVLYYDPSADITKEVAKILDQLAKQAKETKTKK